ncbi:MAG: hypothetical protein IH965_12960 [Gemmatimonadetes bacterium]|nr:hypothetical protein [Gemmatimonadota bacterium]
MANTGASVFIVATVLDWLYVEVGTTAEIIDSILIVAAAIVFMIGLFTSRLQVAQGKPESS